MTAKKVGVMKKAGVTAVHTASFTTFDHKNRIVVIQAKLGPQQLGEIGQHLGVIKHMATRNIPVDHTRCSAHAPGIAKFTIGGFIVIISGKLPISNCI